MISIFWGFFLIFFNFTINNFDLLPDFLGYGLIVYGLGKLAGESEYFKRGEYFSMGMFLLDLFFGLYKFYVGLDYVNSLISLFDIITSIIFLYIIYLIIKGITDLEKRDQLYYYSDTLFTIWKVLVVCHIAIHVLSLIYSEVTLMLATVFILTGFFANIVYLVYLYKVCKKYE